MEDRLDHVTPERHGSRYVPRLTSRVILGIVAVISFTTLFIGLPTFVYIHGFRQQQLWDRIEAGGKISQLLLSSERERLAYLAILASGDPSWRNLLLRPDPDLSAHLQIFQAESHVDLLAVLDADGKPIISNDPDLHGRNEPIRSQTTLLLISDEPARLAMVSIQPLHDQLAGSPRGFILMGTVLDDDYLRLVANQTGFSQAVRHGHQRLASSHSAAAGDLGDEMHQSNSSDDPYARFEMIIGEKHYCGVLVPLGAAQDEVNAFLEVGMPFETFGELEQRTLITLGLSSLAALVFASALGGLGVRKLAAGLKALTTAARKLARGDFDSPIPDSSGSQEIRTLARLLEKSRVNARQTLQTAVNDKLWFENLIHAMKQGIVTFDAHGKITSFSQGAERVMGWKGEQVLRRSFETVFRKAYDDQPVSNAFLTNGVNHRITSLTREGNPISIEVTGTTFVSPASQNKETLLVLRDATEIQTAEDLRAYFLGNITHEFRTPLSAINASVEVMLEEIDNLSTAELSELLHSIHLSVSGLQTLIDNLLESLSIETGRFRLHSRLAEIEPILLDAMRVMEPLLTRRRQELTIAKPERLPLIRVDPTRLTQVFVNLLSNASKYSPIGTLIELSLQQIEGNMLRVTVADRGEGIPIDEKDEIFHRYVRLGNGDRTQYGIGLGLSVVKAIIEQHNGEIGVVERKGGGSVFWFTIPMDGKKHEGIGSR